MPAYYFKKVRVRLSGGDCPVLFGFNKVFERLVKIRLSSGISTICVMVIT